MRLPCLLTNSSPLNDFENIIFVVMKISKVNIARIKQLCKKYRVHSFSAFGSVVRDDFNDDSDIDFVVDFDEKDPFEYTELYFKLKDNLEKLLQRQIDLIEERAIKNQYFRKELEETKVLIYEDYYKRVTEIKERNYSVHKKHKLILT